MATNLNKMAPMDKMATMDKMAAMELDRPVTPSLGIPMEMTPGQIMEVWAFSVALHLSFFKEKVMNLNKVNIFFIKAL